jgi:SAM-dependent methyltransferase
MKPFAEACEQNKRPIRDVLGRYFDAVYSVLEIGSGTGQHAVFFAGEFPGLTWIASDTAANLPGIRAWLTEAALPNLQGPLELDVNQPDWPIADAGAVFSANTVHIMPWSSVEQMFAGIGRVLRPQGLFCLYGPFNYNGGFTSESNARFDAWLRARDPDSGIRDFEAVTALAREHELVLVEDHGMPANNRMLVWQKHRKSGGG